MSGALAIGTGIAASIEALAAGPAVMIGNIALFGFEVPDSMPWGTEQQLADHIMPGGGRIIDAMGPLEATYTWRGAFTGSTASYRAHQLDAMAGAGAAVPLIWGEDYRLVVIRSFYCETTRGGWWLPYTITCIGIPQPGAQAQQPTLLGQTNSDLDTASAVPDQIDPSGDDAVFSQAEQSVSTAQAAVPSSGSLLPGSAAYNSAGSAVGGAAKSLDAQAVTANASIPVSPIPPGSGLLAASGNADPTVVTSAATSTGQTAGITAMRDAMMRSAGNYGSFTP